MKFQWPIDGVTEFPPISPNGSEKYISQKFGAVWISDRDQIVGGIPIKKGDNVYLKVFGWNGHNGIDIAAPKGTTIRAAYDGWIIEQITKDTGYGIRIMQRITVADKNYLFAYGHLNATETPTDIIWNWNLKTYPVKRGQVIGYVNSTGFSTGNHLHWGFYEYSSNGVKLNDGNGYGGGLDPEPYTKGFDEVATNSILVKRLVDGHWEYGFYDPETTGDGLISDMRNRGIKPPLKLDGTLDWVEVEKTVGGTIQPI